MLKKRYSKNKIYCRVTFELSGNTAKEKACVIGEFNEWKPDSKPMKRRKNGNFYSTIQLDSGKEYRFRYLLDGERWENEPAADRYDPNPFGGKDSVVIT